MTPQDVERARALCNHAITNDTIWIHAAEITGTLLVALAEIERLREAERWRDPAVELPASYVGVLVWIDGGICHAEMRDHTDGTRSWGEAWDGSEGNTLNVGMFPVLGWRPLPSQPKGIMKG